MSEKCFCHLNGYKVKDADARAKLAELEQRIANLSGGGTSDGEIPENIRLILSELYANDSHIYLELADIRRLMIALENKIDLISAEVKTDSTVWTVSVGGYNTTCDIPTDGIKIKDGTPLTIHFKAVDGYKLNYIDITKNNEYLDAILFNQNSDEIVTEYDLILESVDGDFFIEPNSIAISTTSQSRELVMTAEALDSDAPFDASGLGYKIDYYFKDVIENGRVTGLEYIKQGGVNLLATGLIPLTIGANEYLYVKGVSIIPTSYFSQIAVFDKDKNLRLSTSYDSSTLHRFFEISSVDAYTHVFKPTNTLLENYTDVKYFAFCAIYGDFNTTGIGGIEIYKITAGE